MLRRTWLYAGSTLFRIGGLNIPQVLETSSNTQGELSSCSCTHAPGCLFQPVIFWITAEDKALYSRMVFLAYPSDLRGFLLTANSDRFCCYRSLSGQWSWTTSILPSEVPVTAQAAALPVFTLGNQWVCYLQSSGCRATSRGIGSHEAATLGSSYTAGPVELMETVVVDLEDGVVQ